MNVTESSKQQSNNVHKCGRKFSYSCIYDADYCHTYIPQQHKEVVGSSGIIIYEQMNTHSDILLLHRRTKVYK